MNYSHIEGGAPRFDEMPLAEALKGVQNPHNTYVTALALVRHFTARIKRLNPEINAVVHQFPDAEAQAEEIDRKVREGEFVGPLAGAVGLHKDVFLNQGVPITAGSNQKVKSKKDAEILQIAKENGVIFLGITNASPYAMDAGATESDQYGRSSNPYDLKRSTLGSSGGDAAALSAGFAHFGIISCGSGSGQIPAAAAGIVSISPFGLLPLDGHFPPFPGSKQTIRMGRPAISARRLEDAHLVANILGNKELLAEEFLNGKFSDHLRLSYFTGMGPYQTEQGPCRVFMSTLEQAAKLGGHSLEENTFFTQQDPDNLAYLLGCWFGSQISEAAESTPLYQGSREKSLKGYSLSLLKAIAGWPIGAALKQLMVHDFRKRVKKNNGTFEDPAIKGFLKGMKNPNQVREEMGPKVQAFKDTLAEELLVCDAIISPSTFTSVAHPHQPSFTPFTVNGQEISYNTNLITIAGSANLGDASALVIPAAMYEGLPVGMRIMTLNTLQAFHVGEKLSIHIPPLPRPRGF